MSTNKKTARSSCVPSLHWKESFLNKESTIDSPFYLMSTRSASRSRSSTRKSSTPRTGRSRSRSRVSSPTKSTTPTKGTPSSAKQIRRSASRMRSPSSTPRRGTTNSASSSNMNPRSVMFWTFLVLYLAVMLGIVKNSKLRPKEEEVPVEPTQKQKKNILAKIAQGVRQLPKVLKPRFQVPKGIYEEAFTEEPVLSKDETQVLTAMSIHMHREIEQLTHRVPHVAWGNNSQTPWYPLGYHGAFQRYAIERLDGATLLHSYYVHMRKKMKDPYNINSPVFFPKRLCKKGCPIEVAIEHTLEWREKYRPWLVSPSTIEENQSGWCYTRGFAKPTRFGRHAMVWSRPGIHSVIDPLSYFRVLLNTLDKAVSESLSHGHSGAFNIVVDCSGYEWQKVPDISHIQQAINMLADHYPKRLGLLVLVNVSKTAELLINIILRLIPAEVRKKIHVMHAEHPREITAGLENIVERSHIPSWLGGTDQYMFDASAYYPKKIVCSEAEARAFLKTMPYHAR